MANIRMAKVRMAKLRMAKLRMAKLRMAKIGTTNLLLLSVPAAVAIALFLGINSYQRMTQATNNVEAIQSIDFDGYAEGVNTVLYNLAGDIEYTMRAEQQRHYKNDITELEQPFIQLFEQGEPDWNIIASQGKILSTDNQILSGSLSDTAENPVVSSASESSGSSANSEQASNTIELSGSVEVYNLDEYGNRTVLTTEFLTVDPDSETMATDLPVQLTSNNLNQTALGLFAELQRDEMTFHQNVEGVYQNPVEKTAN